MKVFITGGTSGIGSSIVNDLASKGNHIYLNYLSNVSEAFRLQNLFPNNITLIQGDITNEDFICSIFNKYKDIDLVINNACLCLDDYYLNKSGKDFLRVLDVNLVAPFIIMKHYSKTGAGIVINMCSTDGIDTYNEYNYDYAASKAGLFNLTKSMAYTIKELKIYGLVLNYVKTPSVLAMEQEFLNSELKRINQKELIEIDTVVNKINDLIDGNYESGYIERIDNNE